MQRSYISRISNAVVLAKAAHTAAGDLLRKKQLQLFGKVLRVDDQHPLKHACFIPKTFLPITDRYVRRVGRPSKEWVRELVQETISLFGDMSVANAAAQCKSTWNELLAVKLGF